MCENCVKENPEDYINELINNYRMANTILSKQELEEQGFERANDEIYENGLYEGQNDKPEKILHKALQAKDGEYLFNIVKDYNPFQVVWELWKRKEDV